MRPKTELLLYHLLWSAEALMRPTFRNLSESFEGWAYRSGVFRQIAELERQQLIEKKPGSDRRICRLTDRGRLHALGGRDPQAQWSRRWDTRWRFVIFDVPNTHNSLRARLRRYLRGRGFGCLQKSVWISPDPLDQESRLVGLVRPHVKSLTFVEGKPAGAESDADLVATAWDFDSINNRYRRYLTILNKKPVVRLINTSRARAMEEWAKAERAAWHDAVTHDPLLPAELLPRGYLGQKAWRRKVAVLRNARRDLDGFCL